MHTRFLVTIVSIVLLSSSALTAAEEIEATGTWAGKLRDESLRKLSPKSGFVADAEAWKTLWSAWRSDEEVPDVDFSQELVLVGTVNGPNLVIMRPQIDDRGAVKFVLGATKVGGPGFGYKLFKIAKEGVTSVNGNPVNDVQSPPEDSIKVTVVGTLRSGVIAIGGETTGTTITASGVTWELDLGKNDELREAAEKLDRQKALVRGSLERKSGVEVKERWIVRVTRLRAAE